MTAALSKRCTAFQGHHLLSAGTVVEVALAVKRAIEADSTESILTFDDATGRVVDLDLRGDEAEIVARLSPSAAAAASANADRVPAPNGSIEPASRPVRPGRPKLGVVAREVTLLPRHWDWLAAQPGGASAALRRLVDEARRAGDVRQRRRVAHEAAYRFMTAIAGDLPGYEEATRALFADDRARFEQQVAHWPIDVRGYAARLAFDADQGGTPKPAAAERAPG
jgi:hypothetical protein